MAQTPHWNIDDPHGILAKDGETRRMVDIYKASQGIDLPTALAVLVKAGYAQLVSSALPMGGSVRNRGGGAPPRTSVGRAGGAGLRVDDRGRADGRQEQSAPKKKPDA
jgi:hypothetical protein